MSNYYFLATALPELKLGEVADISFADLVFLLRENLNVEDLNKTSVVRLYFDLENLRAFWQKSPLDLKGNFDESSLEEALLSGSGMPGYVYDFLQKYETSQDRLQHFPLLIATYFHKEINKADGFLKKYLEFEKNLRLTLVALRAKKIRREILTELQYEDPFDPVTQQIISQKDSKTYEPFPEYEGVKTLYDKFSDDPVALNKALFEYRFQKVNEMTGLHVFTIDYILSYLIKFISFEKWIEQDSEKGMQIINKIIQGAS